MSAKGKTDKGQLGGVQVSSFPSFLWAAIRNSLCRRWASQVTARQDIGWSARCSPTIVLSVILLPVRPTVSLTFLWPLERRRVPDRRTLTACLYFSLLLWRPRLDREPHVCNLMEAASLRSRSLWPVNQRFLPARSSIRSCV